MKSKENELKNIVNVMSLKEDLNKRHPYET